MGKIRSFVKEQGAIVCVCYTLMLTAIILSFSTGIWCFYSTINIDKQPQNWVERHSIASNYNEMKTVFNKQKHAIIDAYNNQVNEIRVNKLKTEANFDGLQFKSDIFKNKIDEIKSTYSKNNTKMLALWTSLNNRVNAKMAKIKAFYDARVRNIYSTVAKNLYKHS